MKRHLVQILSALFLYLAILQIIFGLEVQLRNGLIDFEVYYRYGKILTSGRSQYGPEFTQGIPFNSPPSSFILFATLSFINPLSASLLFTGSSILFFLLTAYSVLKNYFPSKPVRFLILALLFQNFPLKFTLVTGQVNLFVLSFLFLAFLNDRKNKPFLSSIYWSLACMLKLTPVTLSLYFLLRKKYLTLLSGLFIFAGANVFFLFLSPRSLYYLTVHLPVLLTKTGSVTTLYDHSLRAFLARVGFSGNLYWSVLLIVLLFILIIRKFTSLGNLSFFSLILMTTVIGTPFAWQHHYILTFPGFIAASIRIYRTRFLSPGYRIRFLLTLVSAVLVGMHFRDITRPPTSNPFIISHALIGSLILFGLLLIA